MVRNPSCDASGLKRGPWTPEEDHKLISYIQQYGHGSWRSLPQKAGLQRCGKSCRLRWINYLRPDIKRGKFSSHEEQTIVQLHALLGNRWSAIAAYLPKRTDNEIKNYWNTHLKKRLTMNGIDPMTHKRTVPTLGGAAVGDPKNASNLGHIAQWESARVEAETRLVRESKQRQQQQNNHHQPNTSSNKPSISSSADRLLRKVAAPCLDILKACQKVCSNNVTDGYQSSSLGFGFGDNNNNLQSPTSILNFHESTQGMLTLTNIELSSDMNGVLAASCDDLSVWKMGNSNMEDDNSMESTFSADIFVDELGGDDDVCAENNYWNHILELAKCGPSLSPINPLIF